MRTYARCCEPTRYVGRLGDFETDEVCYRDGCGWTGEVERAAERIGSRHEADPKKLAEGARLLTPTYRSSEKRISEKAAGFREAVMHDANKSSDQPPSEITHDGEGRWPYNIDQCPNCGGRIEVEE